MPELLALESVVAGYGGAPVLHGIDLDVGEGEIAVLLGANGVGKTTTLRTITGLLRAWSGAIRFRSRPIEALSAEAVVRLGIGSVPEPPAVFRDMSVLDNLHIGAFALGRVSHREIDENVDRVLSTFSRLRDRTNQTAGSLSGGEQRMLAIGRALVGKPSLLLVDEASMGLSPVMVWEVLGVLDDVRRMGVTVCMVEQNVSALDVANVAYVLEKGQIVHSARGRDIARMRTEVARAYLGRTVA